MSTFHGQVCVDKQAPFTGGYGATIYMIERKKVSLAYPRTQALFSPPPLSFLSHYNHKIYIPAS